MEIQNSDQAKAVQAALLELKGSLPWQILRKELEGIRSSIEAEVFQQPKTKEQLDLLINRRNTISLFLELPDDLIEVLRAP